MARNFLTAITFLGFIISCDNGKKGSRENSFSATPPDKIQGDRSRNKHIYPFDRVITDKKQRKIEAIIIGRTLEEVIFQKKNSITPNKHHRYPISSLSADDQLFFKRLPRKQWEGGGGSIVNGLIKERKRLSEAIADKQKEKLRTPDAKTRIRALDREIVRLERELRDISAKIKEQQAKDAQGG